MSFSCLIVKYEIRRRSFARLLSAPLKFTRIQCRPFAVMSASSSSSVFLTPAEDSVANFKALFENATRREAVQKLSLRTFIDDIENEVSYADEKEYSMDPWHSCIPQLSSLSNLREVSLTFTQRVSNPTTAYHYNDYGTESTELRTTVLKNLFTALDNTALNVSTLSIENLQDCSPGVYEQPAFKNVRAKLKSLHLKIAVEYSEHGPDRDIDIPEKHVFFNRQLNEHWLSPLQHQLTHLSLYASDYWGVFPRWDCRGLRFPHLQSLALGNWSIAHQWQIDWILAHADTLEELYLDDCPIAHALSFETHQHASLAWEDGELEIMQDGYADGAIYPTLRWLAIFPVFAARLTQLKRFGMAHGPWDAYNSDGDSDQAFQRRYDLPARLEVGRYCLFDCGTLPTHWIVEGMRYNGVKEWSEDEVRKLEEEVDPDCCWVLDAEEREGKAGLERLKYPGRRREENMALEQLLEGLEMD
ncbi:hypothetical protein BDV95DRAFT_565003 [Massariosphaeria phaeospora]|uniref:F-box domain-containing protein n=1 Tax=Massariosphaeria phaeospora TaxID=100035 RepID=A0A7C8MDZ4_9PLEO|nr:hypothetical protein BDV95DRAFT_565003 [Massariosphaeria phaeospora]